MPSRSVSVSIPHHLTQDEARTRLQKGLADLRAQYSGKLTDVRDTWTANHLDFELAIMGQKITGRADVLADAVKLDIDLPLILSMLADKIRPQIEQQGRKMLEQQ
jgi:hypothetical protein